MESQKDKRNRKEAEKIVEDTTAEIFLNLMKNIFTYLRSSYLSKINTRKTLCRQSLVRIENQRQRKNFGNNQTGKYTLFRGLQFSE